MKKLSILLVVGLLSVGCSSKPSENQEVVVKNEDKEHIIEVSDSSEKSWVYDVHDIQETIHRHDVLVRVKILSIPELSYFVDSFMPMNDLVVEVLDVYKGDIEQGERDLKVNGGKVRLSDAIEAYGPEASEKYNWLNQEDPENTYLDFEEDPLLDFKVGDEYVMALFYDETKDEMILGTASYAVFNGVEDEDTLTLTNIKTNNSLTITP